MRASRGLKWENKMYKLKRSIVSDVLIIVGGVFVVITVAVVITAIIVTIYGILVHIKREYF